MIDPVIATHNEWTDFRREIRRAMREILGSLKMIESRLDVIESQLPDPKEPENV